MVLKMSRNNIGCHIVGRMLNRCKGINLFPHRQYYDTSRMLSGGSVDSHAALHNPVYLTVSLMHTMLFIIILYITECGFICQRTNVPARKVCLAPKITSVYLWDLLW